MPGVSDSVLLKGVADSQHRASESRDSEERMITNYKADVNQAIINDMNSSIFRDGYAIRDQFATYFLTLTVCGWMDLFSRKVYKDIVIDAFKYAQNQSQLILYAYVIMSNHIHMIAAANERQNKGLSDIIRDFKKFTHHAIIPVIESETESRREWMLHQISYYGKVNPRNESRQIWTNSNHPEECYSRDFLNTKLLYTHENPVRAGIVKHAEDYIYSSASNYAGLGGVIDVVFI